MAGRCLLYYITDRKVFGGGERESRERLLDKIAEAAAAGVDYIQLRERDLDSRELEGLAREVAGVIRRMNAGRSRKTSLLINSRTDVALAIGADGVHLRSDDVSRGDVCAAWNFVVARGGKFDLAKPIVSVACHSAAQVGLAAANGATLALFAPVFEKKDLPGTEAAGLEALREASRAAIPVLALGGVTLGNAAACLRAGANGIAGIRLFQGGDAGETTGKLRDLRISDL